MPRDTLTGTRVRERRTILGLKQSELARNVGISASYLNLIEHNRRRIGGKLLLAIAAALEVEPSVLSEGAEATLIAILREAASDHPDARAEIDRTDEFAGRFPGWAGLLAEDRKRIATLERTVATLTDRLTHDPHLAASLHEMLTNVTSIRSAASILAEPGEIEPEWHDRFVRNVNEDSARLAETSQALVRYLDSVDDAAADIRAPQEEIDAVLARHGYRFDALEDPQTDPAALAADLGADQSAVARTMLTEIMTWMQRDARMVPLDKATDGVQALGPEPFGLASRWGVDPAVAMRRIAVLSHKLGQGAVGLAICDSSGTLVFRQPMEGFPLPRFGAGCPMLPLYQALGRPDFPIAVPVIPPLRDERRFRAFAFARPVGAWLPNRAPLSHAVMLVMPEQVPDPARSAVEIGVSCRICPRLGCPGRQEPSFLTRGV